MATVHVNVGKGYDVIINKNALKNSGKIIAEKADGKAAIITDSNVAPIYLGKVEKSLRESGIASKSFVFKAGERSKNISTFSDILEFLAENGFTRNDCIVALGGGVTGDMSGFAAGCYMRGIKYFQIPTTLLASVDSSVGGKTAIDLKNGKNLAGLFIQPEAVICDTECIKTLSDGIFADGAAEAIKTGILFDKDLFELFETGDVKENIIEIIKRSVMHKGRVVEADERESGLRKLLNLGHTVGHAIELVSDFEISHGRSVAIGTAIMTRFAAKSGYCSSETADRIVNTLRRNGLPITTDFSPKRLAEAVYSDKKRTGNEITVIIPTDIGKAEMKKIGITEIEKIIETGLL